MRTFPFKVAIATRYRDKLDIFNAVDEELNQCITGAEGCT